MSDDQTARLGLPYLAAGQMQKHVTLNEALTRLDALVQTAVVSRTISNQPATPVDGGLYILPASATGSAWAGRPEGTLIRAEAGGWTVVNPPDGQVALVSDAGELVVRDGGAWVALGARLSAVQNLVRLGLGTSADAANPFAARLNKALWTALDTGSGGDGDLRLTFNKEGPADVLSLLFQSGWGGRAELGLIGDDDIRLKVSADGSDWRNVWSTDRTTGRISFDLGATRRTVTALAADGSYAVPVWARTVEAVVIGGGGGGGAGAFGASGPRFGGGGGGAGGVSRAVWPAEQLAAGLTVVVGAGGSGGSSATGSAGGDSAIHLGATALLIAGGGEGGGLGDAASGAAGAGGAPGSNSGGSASATATGGAGASLDRPDAPGGGGAGGSLDGAGTTHAGGSGGDGGALAVRAVGGSSGADISGGAGAVSPYPALHWAGGGGGGGGAGASGTGHAGAIGGSAGGGGGGGGAGVAAGGVGGAGAAGRVWLIAQG